MTRTASDVLRDIDSTKKKIKRYKALRRTLKSAMTVSAPVCVAGLVGFPVFSSWAMMFLSGVAFLVAVGILAWLTFTEEYGYRYTTGSNYTAGRPIAGTGLNVFDHLDRKLGELQEELAAASTA